MVPLLGGAYSAGMTTIEMRGDWNIAQGKLKQKWAQLTDDDLRYVDGKQDELVGRIQKRTGETRETVETALKDFCSDHGRNQPDIRTPLPGHW
jgi:uncharacterized protein YjbJ (UPF0337 family)